MAGEKARGHLDGTSERTGERRWPARPPATAWCSSTTGKSPTSTMVNAPRAALSNCSRAAHDRGAPRGCTQRSPAARNKEASGTAAAAVKAIM